MPERVLLGELLDVVIDHRGKTPKKLGGDWSTCGVPVVSAIHVKDGRIKWDERIRFVSPEMYEKWMPIPLKKGDVLLTSEAPLGQVASVPTDAPLVLSQRLFALRGKAGVLDNGFLRYFLSSADGQAQLIGRSTGTTVIGIRQSQLVQIDVPLPPVDEQRRIAGVLGALDDLIDTNRGLINALEDSATSAFQGAMRRSAAFKRRPIADLCKIVGGSTPSTAQPAFWKDGTVTWATPKDLSRLPSPPLLSTERRITEQGLGQISSGLLPCGTLLMSSRAPVGYLAIAEVPVAVNQGFIAMICDKEVPNVFLWQWLKANLEQVLARANGSTFQEISKANFRPLLVDVPDGATLEAYERAVRPLYQSIVELERENDALRRTRDELLPLLMSGRITPREVPP